MDLKKKAPKGEFLAYINKDEANLLKKLGGSGKLVNGIPSFIGADVATDPDDSGRTGPGKGGYQGGPKGGYGDAGRTGPTAKNPYDKTPEQFKQIREKEKAKYEKQFDGISPLGSRPVNFFTKVDYYDKKYKANWAAKQKQKQLAAIDKLIAKTYTENPHMDIAEIRAELMSQYDGKTNTMTGLEGFNVGKPGMNYGPTQLGPLGLNTKNVKGEPLGTKYMDQTPSLYSHPSNLPSIYGQILGKVSPPNINNLMSSINRINQLTDIQKDGVTQSEITDYYDRAQGKGKYNIFGPDQSGSPQPYIPINYNTGAATIEDVEPYTNDFVYRFGDGQNVGADVTQGFYAANGGRVPRAFGGIMDTATGRRAYGLGSVFKSVGKAIGKVGKAAGKVLKSDLGKAAVLAAGYYYGGGNLFGLQRAGASGFGTAGGFGLSGLRDKVAGNEFFSKMLMNKAKTGFNPFKVATAFSPLLAFTDFAKAPVDQMPGDDGMRGGRLIDPLTGEEGTPASMRANIENAKIEADGDPVKLAALNQKYNNMLFSNLPYENYGTYAQGGRIKAQEGGLMNLGGMEKDYRNEGGFVPIGKAEKADDVPARLSVNEFVFTADAVRNAGGGDIDKGAEVMENMMKNLENGGRISEESQGNTGAQQMFSVSERIGEVI